jgi:ribosomal protein S20
MGILDFLMPTMPPGGAAPPGGGDPVPPPGGFGDMLQKALSQNTNMLGMTGLGLLTARTAEQQRQALMNGYLYGSQMDSANRKEKREEEEKKRKEAQTAAFKSAMAGLYPQYKDAILSGDTESATALIRMAQDKAYKDQSVGMDRERLDLARRADERSASAAERAATAPRLIETPQGIVAVKPDGSSANEVYRNPGADPTAVTSQRRAQAMAAGLKESDPGYQSFLLTGKMPREDAQPLTATDKKAIMEAEEGAVAAQGAVESLMRAKDLNKKAYSGPLAGTRGYITSLGGNEGGAATVELDNELKSNALGQLKAIFGGAPTEGERQILMEIQGSSSLPPDVREKIYNKAIFLANRRLEINKQRAQELRGGDYYKPGGGAASVGGAPAAADGAGGAPTRNPPGTGPKLLRYNPKTGNLE